MSFSPAGPQNGPRRSLRRHNGHFDPPARVGRVIQSHIPIYMTSKFQSSLLRWDGTGSLYVIDMQHLDFNPSARAE